MLFMIETQPRPGVTRAQLVAHFTGAPIPSEWSLIRSGVVTNVLFKIGADVGFYALLSAPTAQEARSIVDRHAEDEVLFDIKLVPVHHFAHFD